MTASGLIPDDQWFRSENGTGLLAGSPLTFFSVTDAGKKILDAIENNEALPTNHTALTKRLLATGAVHPVFDTEGNPQDLTVVIPSYVADEKQLNRLQSLLSSLIGIRIIVVDDCSPISVTLTGAEVIRLASNQGPGAARNAGLAVTETAFIAFVDDDTTVTANQLLALTSHFADESVDVVAPRVASTHGESRVEEYESLHSPLDLGNLPSVVRPLSRVSYVPAAVLVARTHTVKEMNAFDSSMRLGEDVDLIWRLVKVGKGVRYDPSVVCKHEPRSRVRALLKQRFGYETSIHRRATACQHCDAGTRTCAPQWLHISRCRTRSPDGRLVWHHAASDQNSNHNESETGVDGLVFYGSIVDVSGDASLVATSSSCWPVFTSCRSSLCLQCFCD
jgi:mycofactocin glycosyltransferase